MLHEQALPLVNQLRAKVAEAKRPTVVVPMTGSGLPSKQ